VDKNTQNIADLGERLTAVEISKANRNQPNWIAPTLLNGWVTRTGQEVKYMKDEFGYIHFKGGVNTGTLNTTLFYLPKEYRPTFNVHFATYGFNGTSVITGYIVITPDGQVNQVGGSNSHQPLDGITFRAEQQ
jgi:hypothetical protein